MARVGLAADSMHVVDKVLATFLVFFLLGFGKTKWEDAHLFW
jgi:hypothetical protein